MSLTYSRMVRLSDTDAAGVVYFANVLTMCHQAYEESLAEAGINLGAFLSNTSSAIPIVHADVDFFYPMLCGDKLLIHLTPQRVSETEFGITYSLVDASSPEKQLAKATTRHVCINPNSRIRTQLSESILQWLRE